MENTLFYLLSLGAVLAACGVIAARNPIRSVLSLLTSFFCVAVIYLLAGYQFLAAVQILVYAGAIMVLFLFVVMLLNLGDLNAEESSEPMFHKGERMAVGLAVSGALLFVSLLAILRVELPAGPAGMPADGLDPTKRLAEAMFTRYVLPFEAASVLLLATAVGVLVLAKRNRPGQTRPGQEGGEA